MYNLDQSEFISITTRASKGKFKEIVGETQIPVDF